MEGFYEYPIPPDQGPQVLVEHKVVEAEAELRRWAIPDDCLAFARVLSEWDVRLDVIYFLEKPWKWAREYVIWVAAGKGDLTDEMSAAFDAAN